MTKNDKKQDLCEMHCELCKVFTSARRVQILHALRDKELSVGQIEKAIGFPQANISQHLSIMRQKGVVSTRRKSTTVLYKIAYPRMMDAFDIMHDILKQRLADSARAAKDLK